MPESTRPRRIFLLITGGILVLVGMESLARNLLLGPLALGWLRFLIRCSDEMEFDPRSMGLIAACLISITIGFHLFAGWLYTSLQISRGSVQRIPWRLRWSVTIVGLVVLAFLAGIAAIGVTHQATWLSRSPKIWEERRSRIFPARVDPAK